MSKEEYEELYNTAMAFREEIEEDLRDTSIEFYVRVNKAKEAFKNLSDKDQRDVDYVDNLIDTSFWIELYNGL